MNQTVQEAEIAPSSDAHEARAPRPVRSADLAIQPEEAWPYYAEDEIAAVTDVLRSGKVNQWTGQDVAAFERSYDAWIGTGKAIAVANGSVALELPLRAFGVGPGDEVIVTPRTFVASASCVRLVGATPVFADVDRDSGNITAETIARVLTPRTKAIIPVHLGGWPADMPAIMELAESRGIKVIEDCAQAHGAELDGRPVGSFGHAAAFSFCQDKIITTGGEGGLTVFQDMDAWEWAWSFKDHGKSWTKVSNPPATPGFRWLHDSVGTNWRLTGPQAAIGSAQLAKLPAWREARTRNAAIWSDVLSSVRGIRIPSTGNRVTHAYYKFYFYLDAPTGAAALRDEIVRRAVEAGIRLFSGSSSEVYLEKAFDDLPRSDCPVSRDVGERSLMVEVHPTLDPARLLRRAEAVAAIIEDVLNGSSKVETR
jgi:dTDP-4-amino-4,6-dideoxygalactose transaminase